MQEEIFKIQNNYEFEKIALKMFEYQIKDNPIYKSYASLILKNKSPINIYEIPFLPIEFFKKEQIICKGKGIEDVFISSGTGGNRSKHLVSDLSIYRKSFSLSFDRFYGDIKDYCILALLPSYKEQNSSSLVYMIDDLINNSGHEKSGYYLDDLNRLSNIIYDLEKDSQKTILFGVSYALLDLAEKFPQKLKHTTVIETGGMKGKRKEMIKEQMHEILRNSFDITAIHSEYGMTELLSQAYSKGKNIFKTPPWMKILIRDVNDPLTILEANKTGGVNVIDLANIYSCPFIATQDLGKNMPDDSFTILGRFENSDIRGCNLLI